MSSKAKAWVSLLIGAMLAVVAGIVEFARLDLPYAAIGPVSATIGGILIANGWKLFERIEEKPYEYKDALRRFKKHIKKGATNRELFEDLNIWESHAIKAIEDKAYARLFELVVEVMNVCGVVSGNQYSSITHRVEALIVRHSDDDYVIERALPAVLGTAEFFYNKKLYPSVARILVTFARLCEHIASLSPKKLEIVAEHLLTTSKVSLSFRKDESLDVFYCSIFYRILWLLQEQHIEGLSNEYRLFLSAQPEKKRLESEKLAKSNYDFDSLSERELVDA